MEEDWELVLNEPGAEQDSPQFSTVMSPNGGTSGTFIQVNWNYREEPMFASGGAEVALYQGGLTKKRATFSAGALSQSAETVAWTSVLKVDGTELSYWVASGNSSSWGSFGGSSMTVKHPSLLSHLNNYSKSVSAANSGITYGANRVNKLVLKRVRKFGANGLISTDETPVVVYQLSNQ